MTSPIGQADDQAYRAWRDKLGLSMKTPRPRGIVELVDRMESSQYGAVDGPVSHQVVVFTDAREAADAVKAYALEAGADLVGITTLKLHHLYKGQHPQHRYAVSLGMRMHLELLQTAPDLPAAVEVIRVYHDLGEITLKVAAFIRGLGYSALAHHPTGPRKLLHVPVAVDAGLGELGRHDSVIHPKLGSSFRLGTVTTDLPLKVDVPLEAGIADFCIKCTRCIRWCPVDAIPLKKSTRRGLTKFYIDLSRCLPYFLETEGCGVCIAQCTYTVKAARQLTSGPVD
jgi:Pyruvate/2-oxoacid:ferredoxin oxidoreductase delta subunit